MSDGTRSIEIARAQQLQTQADFLTSFRDASSYITGPALIIDGPSWE